jgi:hypothetical protein
MFLSWVGLNKSWPRTKISSKIAAISAKIVPNDPEYLEGHHHGATAAGKANHQAFFARSAHLSEIPE